MKRFLSILSFPHLVISYIVLLLSILSIWLSSYFHLQGDEFIASLFSNIFAGLITGLIICLVSGVKNIYKIRLKDKAEWLQQLSGMCHEYLEMYNAMLHRRFSYINDSEEIYDLVYDVASRANWINEFILQSVYDKTLTFDTIKYCQKRLEYDAFDYVEVLEALHQDIIDFGGQNTSKKVVIKHFDSIDKILRKLNIAVHSNIRGLKIRISDIDRTIL